MKIAIPVKMKREDPPLAPLFGKAKWFAIVEGDQVGIVENPVHGGRAVVAWLEESGVDVLIFQEMGKSPYEMLRENGKIELFHAGYERIMLHEVVEKFEKDALLLVDDTNITDILMHHDAKHTH